MPHWLPSSPTQVPKVGMFTGCLRSCSRGLTNHRAKKCPVTYSNQKCSTMMDITIAGSASYGSLSRSAKTSCCLVDPLALRGLVTSNNEALQNAYLQLMQMLGNSNLLSCASIAVPCIRRSTDSARLEVA